MKNFPIFIPHSSNIALKYYIRIYIIGYILLKYKKIIEYIHIATIIRTISISRDHIRGI